MDVEEFFDGEVEIGDEEVAMDAADPGGLDHDGGATGAAGGFGILPFVADDEGAVEVDVPFEAGFLDEAGLGFAAGAAIGFVMRADEDVIDGQGIAEELVHAVQLSA